MPHTTQRNRVNGPNGQVVVNEKTITVFFKPDGERATFPVSAKEILSLTSTKSVRTRMNGVTLNSRKQFLDYLLIKKKDSAVELWLHQPIDGSCDLMVVSRRGLRRAARKALRMRRSK